MGGWVGVCGWVGMCARACGWVGMCGWVCVCVCACVCVFVGGCGWVGGWVWVGMCVCARACVWVCVYTTNKKKMFIMHMGSNKHLSSFFLYCKCQQERNLPLKFDDELYQMLEFIVK